MTLCAGDSEMMANLLAWGDVDLGNEDEVANILLHHFRAYDVGHHMDDAIERAREMRAEHFTVEHVA